jgi:aminotransferase
MEHKISKVVRGSAPSVIREMFQRAAALDGVISLGIGDPDFHTPEDISRAALEDALAGHTHYTSSQGDPELLAELAAYLNRRYGFGLDPSEIVITSGGMGAIAASMRALLDQDDEVVLPEPYFPDYEAHIAFANGRTTLVPTRAEQGFVPQPGDLAAAISPKAKVLLLNSPNNPTGAVIPKPVLEDLAKLAIERDLIVISDEVYDRQTYEGEHFSIRNLPGMKERTVVIGSFSKSFAMTGWRLGWAVCPSWFVPHLLNVVTHNTSCANSVSQRAALAALRQPDEVVDAMAREFEQRCRTAYEALSAVQGVTISPPRGSFYLFPKIAAINGPSRGFCLDLLEQERVVVVPGESFGPSGQGCVRLACTVAEPLLSQALKRLTRFIKGYAA